MISGDRIPLISGVFLTFSGNCRSALSFYQTCFGGTLQFLILGKKLPGFKEVPVIRGSLISEKIVIYGSDLVHNEGRNIGNYISIFLRCGNRFERKHLLEKFLLNQKTFVSNDDDQELIEVTDAFDVRWVLSV